MKLTLTTINSKYIHTNLALYLLEGAVEDLVDTTLIEFTSKEENSEIVDKLVNSNALVFGFSIYIWNVVKSFEVIKLLKTRLPQATIIVGGPEVSYDADYFLGNNPEIDYLVSGEGEQVLRELMEYLIENKDTTNLKISTPKQVKQIINKTDLTWLQTLSSPYRKLDDIKNRIVYFESSRGCPFKCSFCLSSLEDGVRFFDLDYLKGELKYLIDNGVRTLKFLDRTFNTKLSFAYEIFDFIIEHHKPNQTFQFEITGDILPVEIIDYLNQRAPKGLFRFEIGIQSTNDLTNQLVDRVQNLDILLSNIQKIQAQGIIDLHLDLIAGLPKEDYHSFERTFNDIFSIKPLELQLGFLKMLRGTKIRNQATLYQYHYDEVSPYEIKSHQDLSEKDIFNIHLAEEGLEKYWNKHKTDRTINYLVSIKQNYFQLFYEIGKFWFDNYQSFTGFQNHDLYERLYLYAKANFEGHEQILDLIKFDYLVNSKTKPKRFYQTLDKKTRNGIYKQLLETTNLYTTNDLYKYSYLEELTIHPLTYKKGNYYLVVTYQGQTSYNILEK